MGMWNDLTPALNDLCILHVQVRSPRGEKKPPSPHRDAGYVLELSAPCTWTFVSSVNALVANITVDASRPGFRRQRRGHLKSSEHDVPSPSCTVTRRALPVTLRVPAPLAPRVLSQSVDTGSGRTALKETAAFRGLASER
ncbi:unnamed protein product [Lampetra fluviatilis]